MCVKMRSVKGPGVWPRPGAPAAVGSEREATQPELCRWGCGRQGGRASGGGPALPRTDGAIRSLDRFSAEDAAGGKETVLRGVFSLF